MIEIIVSSLLNEIHPHLADRTTPEYLEIASIYLHDLLNIGVYDEVDERIRRAYAGVCYLKACSLSDPREALKVLDKGFLLGLPFAPDKYLLQTKARELHQRIDVNRVAAIDVCEKSNVSAKGTLINTYDSLSLEKFLSICDEPFVIKNGISYWKAVEKWKDLNYLLRICAHRTVPIETGDSYSANNFGQTLMTIGEFVQKFMMDSCTKKGYLAQHDLLEQIPELQPDILIPDYCLLDSECTHINVWLGPKNTVSTLHQDPKDNFLCQVFGSKLVQLFAPEDRDNLYPGSGLFSNTSTITDPLKSVDLDKFPQFGKAQPFHCTLDQGDMLYIPKLWWHHVVSMTNSCSVNFWFNAPRRQ